MRGSMCSLWLPFVLASFARADIIVGTNNAPANLFPFNDSYVGEYQQVYTSTAFPGVSTITGLKFAPASGFSGSNTVTLTIGLSTTFATVASMSTNYAANKGADFTQVFAGSDTYTATGSDLFDLSFATTAFTYNPGLGNLLLDIFETSNSGAFIAFDANQDSVTSRVFNLAGNGMPTFSSGYGLVTDFVTSSTVPEPTSLLLLGSVVALVGTILRRRIASP